MAVVATDVISVQQSEGFVRVTIPADRRAHTIVGKSLGWIVASVDGVRIEKVGEVQLCEW